MENLLQNIKISLIKFFKGIDSKVFIIIALLGIIYFLLQSPIKETIKVPVIVEVEVPGKQGEIKIDSIPVPYRVNIKNPINKELQHKYETANDSIKKLLYIMAVAEKEYNISFKDSIQNINVYSKIVNGKLADQNVKYDIFPTKQIVKTEVEIEIPKRNELYYGFELGVPVNFLPNLHNSNPKPYGKFNLRLKNKKNNIWSGGIDTEGRLSIGYDIKF